jgi:uncharacterized protein YdeI (YjbR/CyaY-like superfamily)
MNRPTSTTDQRVDKYIANAQPFARPILTRLRQVVHAACPEATETIKWGFPAFMYHGILCGMAAFKEHCTFGFWHPLMRKTGGPKEAMGNYGRITCIEDLPALAVIRRQIKTAMTHHTSGAKAAKPARARRPALPMPVELTQALKAAPAARTTFAAFPPSAKREYIEWITEAKRPATRAKRLATTVQWLTEGKRRNWEYEDCRTGSRQKA